MAIDYFKKCVARAPNYVDGYYQLALAYLNQGDMEKAKDLVGEELAAHPDECELQEIVPLHWSEPEPIAEALAQGYPDLEPLDLRFDLVRLYAPFLVFGIVPGFARHLSDGDEVGWGLEWT